MLGGGGRGGREGEGGGRQGGSTLWEMTSNAEKERENNFYVPALDLPPNQVMDEGLLAENVARGCKLSF